MDLSKAFDCLPHELLIAKLDAYGFSINALKLIKNYLQERTERVKINSNYSDGMQIKQAVLQGSTLGPPFFKSFYQWFTLRYDDNTIWIKDKDIDDITTKLNQEMNIINKWFKDNSLILNGENVNLWS